MPAVEWLLVCMALVGCGVTMPPLPDRGAGPGGGQPVLSVAVLTPLSGELATFGEAVRNGVGLAFDEWNARGGTAGQRLQPVWVDTPCEAGAAQQVAEQVVADGVRFIVGGMCTEAAVPIARVADQAGALFVATSATHPRVTVAPDGAVRPLVFATALPYPSQGRAAAHFIVDTLGVTRTAVFAAEADPFARDILAAFEPAMALAGGQVLTTVAVGGPEVDLAVPVAAAVNAGAGAFYVPGNLADVARVSSAARAAGLDLPIVGSDWWSEHDLDPAALAGVYLVSHYNPDPTDAAGGDWAQRYRSAFAVEPDALAALGYDAANLLAMAVERIPDPSPAAVAQTIATTEYSGVTGRWRFDAWHAPLKAAVFVRVSAAGLERVGTADVR